MKNMFDKIRIEEMKVRVQKLTPDSNAQWGKLTVHGMLCHLQDQMTYGLGMVAEVKDVAKGPPMWVRHLLRLYVPIPKGKVASSAALKKNQPGDWDKDKTKVLELMDTFLENKEKETWPSHPFFGPLTGLDWARITWRHNHHHLTQFGV